MILAQQKYRLKEQDRKPRNEPKPLWSINLWQGGKNIHSGGKIVSSTNGTVKTGELSVTV